MSYAFIDIERTETPSAAVRPAEALIIGGVYLEDVIPGYRTLSVIGRETIPVEITELTNQGDGGRFLRKRYKGRTIKVKYQLIAESDTAFREAFNALASILDQDQMEIRFADETDKFFVGTKSEIGTVPAGRNAVTGEFSIYCADPFKYTNTKYAVPVDGTITVDYEGTYPAAPVIDAVMNGENGFVAYIDDEGHVIQIGDPEEIDGEPHEESTVVVNDMFPSGSISTAKWITGGSSGSSVICDTYGAHANNYGSGTGWIGPMITTKSTTPALENFTLAWRSRFYAEDKGQTGRVIAEVMKDGGSLARMEIIKSSQTDLTATIKCYVLDTKVKEWTGVKVGRTDTTTGISYGGASIERFGNSITFQIADKKASYTTPDLEGVVPVSARFKLNRYSGKSAMAANTIRRASFLVHDTNAWRDIRNKFQPGNDVEADCRNGEITMDGAPQYGLGALGNDWEAFRLRPGMNHITTMYSDWATAPDFVLSYREVYL